MEKKILLVDDEEGIRKVLGISLADSGYQVLTAKNGEEALETFRAAKPPIVLTDIKMPGMDGITLLKTIKAESPDTEVIMITGHGDMDLAIHSLQYKAVDFVTKPINDDILEIALKRATEKISMREQIRQYTQNLETLVKEQSAKLVQTERQAAVGQTVDGLYTAIKGIVGDLEGGLRYFNEMPCYVSIHDRDLKVVEVNQLFRQRLGDRVGGRSWEIFANGGQRPCPAELTFETGMGQRLEKILHDGDQGDLPVIVHTAPIRNRDGELELVMEIAVDVSEVNRLREELRTTQQRYEQLFDEVPCYITVQNRDFKLMASNRRFKEDFDSQDGAHCFDVYKQRDTPCVNCPVAKTFEDGKSHQTEMVVTSKSGEQVNVLIQTAPIRDARGNIVQVMEMSTNITQIRQLQDNLTSLGFLISSISHGVKGLLTGLDGGMYLINSGLAKKDQEKIQEGWDVVELMVGRIRNMIGNILFYAKERALQWQAVDVNGFADDISQTVKFKMAQHDIVFEAHLQPSLGKFDIDAGVLRSALINILENAIEATLADSTKKPRKIVFDVRAQGDDIVLDISDNGIGMDRETRNQMFTLFFSSKGNQGTGLGLYIAHRVVGQHGGSLKVESALGLGTRFRVTLPKNRPQNIPHPRSEKPQPLRCA